MSPGHVLQPDLRSPKGQHHQPSQSERDLSTKSSSERPALASSSKSMSNVNRSTIPKWGGEEEKAAFFNQWGSQRHLSVEKETNRFTEKANFSERSMTLADLKRSNRSLNGDRRSSMLEDDRDSSRRSTDSPTNKINRKTVHKPSSSDETTAPWKQWDTKQQTMELSSSSTKKTMDDSLDRDISNSSRRSSSGSNNLTSLESSVEVALDISRKLGSGNPHPPLEKKTRRTIKPSPDEIIPWNQWGSQRKLKTTGESNRNKKSLSRRSRSVGREKGDSKRRLDNKAMLSSTSEGRGIANSKSTQQPQHHVKEQSANGTLQKSRSKRSAGEGAVSNSEQVIEQPPQRVRAQRPKEKATTKRVNSQKLFEAPILDKDESHARRKREGTSSRPKSQPRVRQVDASNSRIQSARPKSQPRARNGDLKVSNSTASTGARATDRNPDSNYRDIKRNVTPPKKRRGFLQGLKQWGSKRGGFSEQNIPVLHQRTVTNNEAKGAEVFHTSMPDLAAITDDLKGHNSDEISQTAQSDITLKCDNVHRADISLTSENILETKPRSFLYLSGKSHEVEPLTKRHDLPRKSDNKDDLTPTTADELGAPSEATPNSMGDEINDRPLSKKSKKKRKHRKDSKKKSKERRSKSLVSPPLQPIRKSASVQSLEDYLTSNRPAQAKEPAMLWRSSSSEPGTPLEAEKAKSRHLQLQSREQGREAIFLSQKDPKPLTAATTVELEDRRAKLSSLMARSMSSRFSQRNLAVEPSLSHDNEKGERLNVSLNSSRMTMSISVMDISAGSMRSVDLESSANSISGHSKSLLDNTHEHIAKPAKHKKKGKKKKKKESSTSFPPAPPFAGITSDDDFPYV